MPENNKRIVRVGSLPFYEIEQSAERIFVTIREVNNPNREVEVLDSVIPMLIEALQALQGTSIPDGKLNRANAAGGHSDSTQRRTGSDATICEYQCPGCYGTGQSVVGEICEHCDGTGRKTVKASSEMPISFRFGAVV